MNLKAIRERIKDGGPVSVSDMLTVIEKQREALGEIRRITSKTGPFRVEQISLKALKLTEER